MSAPRKRSRRKDATPIATIARALVAADVELDAVVAKRLGVSKTLIQSWRKRLGGDEVLLAAVSAERYALLERWRVEAAATSIAIAKQIRRVVAEGGDLPFSLIAAAKVYGAMNIEAEALLEPPSAGAPNGEQVLLVAGNEVRH